MNKESIKVSVCMITYAHENYIQEAIIGVLMQECNFEIEIIVADDNSPDKTENVIKSFSNHPKYRFIKYVKHKKNKGMISNFKWASEQCTGEYIALCEGDDYWTDPLKLQKQVDFLETNDKYSFCFHDNKILDENTGKIGLRVGKRKIDYIVDLKSVIIENNISTASLVFRNILDFDNLPIWFSATTKGDYGLIVLLAERGFGKYIPEPMSVYRVHRGGVWSGIVDTSIHYQENLKFYKLIKDYFFDKNIKKIIKQKQNYVIQNHSIQKLRKGEFLLPLINILGHLNGTLDARLNISFRKVVSSTKQCILLNVRSIHNNHK
jgi:glycosyltransferase involved in cell wall biosynthesis